MKIQYEYRNTATFEMDSDDLTLRALNITLSEWLEMSDDQKMSALAKCHEKLYKEPIFILTFEEEL